MGAMLGAFGQWQILEQGEKSSSLPRGELN